MVDHQEIPGERMLYTKFLARLVIFAILVKLHSGLMRERTSTSAASGIVIQNNGIYMAHVETPRPCDSVG